MSVTISASYIYHFYFSRGCLFFISFWTVSILDSKKDTILDQLRLQDVGNQESWRHRSMWFWVLGLCVNWFLLLGFPGSAGNEEPACQCRRQKQVWSLCQEYHPCVRKIPWRTTWQPTLVKNPMERGAWRAIVHRVTKSWIQLKQLSMHTHTPS